MSKSKIQTWDELTPEEREGFRTQEPEIPDDELHAWDNATLSSCIHQALRESADADKARAEIQNWLRTLRSEADRRQKAQKDS